MTDKRYFALIGEDGYVYPIFFDSENEDKEIDVDIVVDLLNENEQLKEFAQHNYSESKKIISNLQKENEQLKNRLKDWHQKTFKAHEYFNILEKVIDEVCNDDISNQIWKEYEKREKLIE